LTFNARGLDVLALHIRAQNCGLIIRHHNSEVVFEMFELSPSNEAIMSCAGKLICSYPGPAIAISHNDFHDPKFLKELSALLTGMYSTKLEAAMMKTKKAGVEVPEARDSASPMYITELLTGILRGCGQESPALRFSKRIAD